MPSVPHTTHTRASHMRRIRATHDYDAAMEGITNGAVDAAEQAGLDGVVNPGGVQPGTQDGGIIIPGTLDIAPFAADIRPVILWTGTLPTLPDTSYPIGQFVYKTDDVPPRLYKNVADVWVAAIGPNDIQADSITAGQIAAGAISTSELAVGARLTGEVANQTGATPGVFIDASGILIRDGKLTLQDEFGTTVAGASGFTGGWSDQINTGIYNSSFGSGSTGVLAVGRLNSLPYWTYAKAAGSPTLNRTADVNYASGFKCRATFSAFNDSVTLLSDKVPARAGMKYVVSGTYGFNWVAGQLDFVLSLRYYDASDVFISSTSTTTFASSALDNTVGSLAYGTAFEAPAKTAYVRIQITMRELTAHSSSNWVECGLAMFHLVPEALDNEGYYRIQNLQIGDGVTTGAAGLIITDGPSDTFQLDFDGGVTIFAGNASTSYAPSISNDGTATYTTRLGNYYRLGAMVFVSIEIVVNAVGAGGGNVTVNLPSAPGVRNQIISGYALGFTTFADGPITMLASSGSASAAIRDKNNVTLSRAHYAGSALIRLTGFYMES